MTEEIHELSAAYALHALDGEELRMFEVHLDSCRECQLAVRDHQATAASLAGMVETPPPRTVKDKLMAEIEHVPQHRTEPIADVIDIRSRVRSRALMAVAAAAVLIAGVVGVMQIREDSRPDQFASILESDDAQMRELSGEGAGVFSVAWSPSAETFALQGVDVPAVSADLTYEFWFIGDGDPINAGLFNPEDGSVDLTGTLPGEPAVWAITIEPAGGSPAPTSDIIYLVET